MIDFNQPNLPAGPVVQLTGVHVPVREDYDVGMTDVSLTVNRGDLVMIELEHGTWNHPLVDVISGLVPVEQGTVKVFGGEWENWGPDTQARARWRIGRVFDERGWLSNLDIDENITLSERHHTSRPLEDIESEVNRLARMVGLETIPQGRPALADREELRRTEWVRAALGNPWLMLLERPGRDLTHGWMKQLLPLIDHVRKNGTAVVWMAADEDEIGEVSLNPSLKFTAKENTLSKSA